ncbi:MAG TPA: TRAP transporter substrate-binding protein [Usitatibacteraceae bacterium]|nr:TRAP transporter substrate-binding protein [Usitatibacteraceae bacterium]
MQRRKFLTSAATGLAAGAAMMPTLSRAQAAALPEVKWRLASSFPKSLDTLFGTAEFMSKRVAACTGGKFQIQVFAAGELVPGLQVLDAVQNGTVQACHTAPYYFWGKDPAFALDCALPFGLNARQMNAWQIFGGGLELLREFYKGYNVHNIPCGNTGAQMGGWFRKEIKTVADLKGLKFRISGYAGKIIEKQGGVPQQIAGGDIYPALEKGTIDAAEWVGPYDDEKLGFNKVAKYYYYPGWWEGGPQLSAYFNVKEWDKLPKEYQNIVEAACGEANSWMLAKYDAQNPAALKRLVASGTQLRAFSREIMVASYKATLEVNKESSEKSPAFKKIYESMVKFRDEELLWFRVADKGYDDFMHGIGSIK